jgi:hypothetical protein
VDLDQLDAERRGPFSVRLRGKRVVLPEASTLPWKAVASTIGSAHSFMEHVWPKHVDIPAWMVEKVQERWCLHQGLTDLDQTKRLVYTMHRYAEAIEYDLREKMRLSAGEMWRDRRWRELLNLVDGLPSNTMTSQALANDKEHLRMVLKQSPKQKGSGGPRLADWSLTNAQLATLIDAVNAQRITMIGLARTKGAKPSFEPQARPRTAVDEIEYEMRKAEHQGMVDLLLPHKAAEHVESP